MKTARFAASSLPSYDKPRQSGNVMVYILIALALIAALTVALSRQSDTGGDDLSHEQAEILSAQAMGYVTTVANIVNQMVITGIEPQDIDFVRPDASAYNTPPHWQKIFHPDGGGLILQTAGSSLFPSSTATPAPGWYLGRFNNIIWTPSSAPDIILAAHNIPEGVCARINRKITGSADIPTISARPLADYFVDASVSGGGSNSPLTVSACAECEERAALCVADGPRTQFTFYTIIEGL